MVSLNYSVIFFHGTITTGLGFRGPSRDVHVKHETLINALVYVIPFVLNGSRKNNQGTDHFLGLSSDFRKVPKTKSPIH